MGGVSRIAVSVLGRAGMMIGAVSGAGVMVGVV